jgi:hypothetical protein
VKSSANLNRLEEVLVITKKEDRAPAAASTGTVRAVDILTQRLPSVPDKPAADADKAPAAGTPATPALGSMPTRPKPQNDVSANRPAGTLPVANPADGGVKPATSRKPSASAKKSSEQITKPETNTSGTKPSEPGTSDPGTSEDKPH